MHENHSSSDKSAALIITIIAGLIALAHTVGTNAQTMVIVKQMELTNAWNFYQSKVNRQSTLKTAIELQEFISVRDLQKAKDNTETWKSTIARYESEPDKKEGKKELFALAKSVEKEQTEHLHAFHKFEISVVLFEIAIVLVSASVITNIRKLKWGGVLIASIGVCFFVIGKWYPMGFQ